MTSFAPSPPRLQTYWQASRAPRYSLLFALPLFVVYQVLVVMQPAGPRGTEWRNGADAILQQLFTSIAGSRGPLVFLVLLTALGLWLVVLDRRAHRGPLAPWVFGVMLVEAVALSLVSGAVVGGLTSQLVRSATMLSLSSPQTLSLTTKLMLSVGAGLYEELLFRVLLVGLLVVMARALFGWKPVTANAYAALIGAAVFSAFHYLGPYGDRLELYSFVFRFVAGLFFSLLYVTRGFGITAWTHALYDVFVIVIAPSPR